MEGPSIRDYIDARKKSGLSWEEFRALKEQGNENEFSTSAMADWRKQLDAEREAKLSKSIGRKARKKDAGREGDGSGKEHKRCQSSKHRHHRPAIAKIAACDTEQGGTAAVVAAGAEARTVPNADTGGVADHGPRFIVMVAKKLARHVKKATGEIKSQKSRYEEQQVAVLT
ncbi:hypothetical protein COEREDRAFT_97978 [Coemansia reversa NRRL 1564]|uniref:Uncharacterized protein n=1 Tax=Coemansia reversa (strain ATCC 12441 / NRRL 1564) TaxID=763665 RepID=A0A2G5B9F7_COERN|nr:hypothetical protein COEREDRAFT_97978 [Coemansia reversa NRRL 1564]|eukprot:PIA15645.1 hypothetical protein COEREDRAFT_97978 [Coemansia reversa NRRL 1564]